MIKQIYVCECDICGAIEKAKAVNAYRNDTEYQMPNDWTHGKNSEICICPTCSAKLSGSKTTPSLTYNVNAEAVPVYGCPTVVLDNLHDALLSSVTTEDPAPVYGCSATTVLWSGLDE